MRCSYQPIALTSSVRDVIVRVKVRIYDDNSAACSWYCSVAISSFFHLLYSGIRQVFADPKTFISP